MSTIYSYDLNGKKLSFANWISNLSPEETPFSAMTKKEKVNQVMFQWQSDYLNPSGTNATVEGVKAVSRTLGPTSVHHNYTQILRKVVKVSDTADSIANYGREDELAYQAMKAGKEMKRDLEWAFMNNRFGDPGSGTDPRITAGFRGLVAQLGESDHSTGAVVYRQFDHNKGPTYADLTDMMYNLYLSGSKANIIMYNPKYAAFFSSLQEGVGKVRLFENTQLVNLQVKEIISPWCQRFKLVPNRWIESNSIFFFNPEDFTQMVLREPKKTPLAKAGSSEKLLFEMEVGLRLSNPFAAGVLEKAPLKTQLLKAGADTEVNGVPVILAPLNPPEVEVKADGPLEVTFTVDGSKMAQGGQACVIVYGGNGIPIVRKENVKVDVEETIMIHNTMSKSDEGLYRVVLSCDDLFDDTFKFKVKVI